MKIIIKNLKDKLKKIFSSSTVYEIIFRALFVILAASICLSITGYGYKAFLYPIRMSQFFDECSYIATGKYFRTIPPGEIIKEYLLKNKPIPRLYNEFDSRQLLLPFILSFPLGGSDGITGLHKFFASFMALGAIVFFLIGLKLGGISGGVTGSALWIGIPLLNYWGHLFMTENPSYIFLALGFLLLLCSDRSGIASFAAGVFFSCAFLTRLTTAVLIFPAPFFIIALYFSPFKRKSFQLLGEMSKLLGGFVLAALPYFIFITLLFQNPLLPFYKARVGVNNYPLNDLLYYAANLWIEGGSLLKLSVILGMLSTLVLPVTLILRKMTAAVNEGAVITEAIETGDKNIIRTISMKIEKYLKYPKIYFSGFIYYFLIIMSSLVSALLYIVSVSEIPHKIPRYLAGVYIPLIIVAILGIGMAEKLLMNFFKFSGKKILLKIKKIRDLLEIKIIVRVLLWLTGLSVSIIIIALIAQGYWNSMMNRPFKTGYEVSEEAVKQIIDRKEDEAIPRLQPEYNAWAESISDRLTKIGNKKDSGVDNTDYYGKFNRDVLEYLNSIIKPGEVLYLDRTNMIPYTPSYSKFPCMMVSRTYNYSINNLIKAGDLSYNGYVLINADPKKDLNDIDKTSVRSLNKEAVLKNTKFKFVKKTGSLEIYYYKSGILFSYLYGIKTDAEKEEHTMNEHKQKQTGAIDDMKKIYEYSIDKFLKFGFKNEESN